MGYNRLVSPDSASSSFRDTPSVGLVPDPARPSNRKKRPLLLFLLAVVLLVAGGMSAAVLIRTRSGSDSQALKRPTQAIDRTCIRTTYPNLCVNSLVNFPGALGAKERDLVHLSMNMTLQRFGRALYGASAIAGLPMDRMSRSAYDACLELLDTSMDQLSRSLTTVSGGGAGAGENVRTWLSAAVTNQDTCTEGLAAANGRVRDEMGRQLRDLAELVSNCLAIFSAAGKDFSGIPIQNRRRRRLLESEDGPVPAWMGRRDRRLLALPAGQMQYDYKVSKDGNGTHKTIEAAIKAAPEYSTRRIIIYITAGRYDENLKVGRKKTNLMFVGDGKGLTIIAGSRSVLQNFTTFHTATFAATGTGFIARDITFQNWAGPENHQAVALRVGADHAVVYRCNVIGYQDSLYVHSQRQFFRECDVYGTVDFIFGNAAVVFQNCSLWARKPMPFQKITITAQNRKDPNQNTGISIHNCRILATGDLEAARSAYPTYLGRPWKLYSRVVYMMSYIGDHVHPSGCHGTLVTLLLPHYTMGST